MKIFLKSYKFTCLFFIICFFIPFYILRSYDINLFYSISFGISNSLALLGIVLFIASLKKVFRVLLIILLAIIIMVDLTYFFYYSGMIGIGIIASIIETNQQESFATIKLLLPTAILSLSCSLVLLYLTVTELQHKKRTFKYSIICIIVSAISVSYLSYLHLEGNRKKFLTDLRELPATLTVQGYISWQTPLVIHQISSTIAYFTEINRFKNIADLPRTLPNGIYLDTLKQEVPQTVFIIIGESSSQMHYSLYGYDLKTSPLLDKLNEDHLTNHYNAISPAPVTIESVPLTLTFANYKSKEEIFSQKNIVSLAKDANYKTYWISNQDKVGILDSHIGIIAAESDHSEFYNFKKDDLFLIDRISSFYNPKQKQIFFIHLRGNHLPYSDKFDELDSIPNARMETLDYDKSIHHTDRVLAKLYSTFFEKDSINSKELIYYSDHGELVNHGHGFRNKIIKQYLIPFITFSQPNNNLDKIVHKYMNDSVINVTNLVYIFAESIGYHIDDSIIMKAKEEGRFFLDIDRKYHPVSSLVEYE